MDDVLGAPHDFDEALVRVSGLCHLYFEGTALSTAAQRGITGNEAVWLDVGWPLSEELAAMNGEVVVVEARFDADLHGHWGAYRGTLTDIRAIWRPGRESEAYVLNHETRADALEQLEFRTGWITLGTRIRNGYRHGNQINSGWIQTWFEFLASPRVSGEKRIPKTGDRIRLTERL